MIRTIAERLADWRGHIIRDSRFQRFAARFLLTRPLARKKAQALFDITAGFVYSQILLACVELGLFARLANGPHTLDELAQATGLHRDQAGILLNAAASLDLLAERSGGRYALGDLGAALLATPGLPEMIEHHRLLYRDLQDPVALLRDPTMETRLRDYWAYARPNSDREGAETLGAESVGDYSALMAASQGFIAGDVLDAYDFSGVEAFADIGGGQGAFMAAALMRHPDLHGVVFDLPAVAERAARVFKDEGLADRGRAEGGDFFTSSLPSARLMTLVRVLYDHQDDNVRRILANVFRALPAGGRVLIAEPMEAGAGQGSRTMGAAYFGLYLLAMGGGRARSFERLSTLLREAGFDDISAHPSARPLLVSVMSARKPDMHTQSN